MKKQHMVVIMDSADPMPALDSLGLIGFKYAGALPTPPGKYNVETLFDAVFVRDIPDEK